MHIINHKDNIRLVSNYHRVRINGIAKVYKVQIKVLWFWLQLKNLMKMNIMTLLIVLDIVLILI